MAASFSNLDLNLLKVFDAVMEDRSVLRASQRIFLSQSAVSHSLARLRELLEDDLFVRTARGMQPTARAIEIGPTIRDALQKLERAIGSPSFDPSTSCKTFTLAASDFMTMVIAPRLLGLLKQEAPNVNIVIRPGTRIDLAEQIDLGRIDVAIGTFAEVPHRLKAIDLFEYGDVLIACASCDYSEMTIEKMAALRFVTVSLGGDKDGAVDGFIFERGLARRSEMYDRAAFERTFAAPTSAPRITISLPHFLAVPALLDGSDLVAIVPWPLAEIFARSQPLSIYQLPYPTSVLNVRVVWHERNEGEAAHRWLHGMLKRATEHLRPTPAVRQAT